MKNTAQKTQDIEGVVQMLEQDVKQLQERIEQAVTINDFSYLEKKVDGLPTFKSISALDDKFREYWRHDVFDGWKDKVDAFQQMMEQFKQDAVTREVMTGQLVRMRELIDSNFHKCSKVTECTEDRNSFLNMLKSNSRDDAERKKEILEIIEKIKHL